MADDRRAPTLRVLYAEDNPFDADLTAEYFRTKAPGFELEIVGSGTECLARLASQSYDVLLLDNHLPDVDGLDVLRDLTAKRKPVPVVMTTAMGDESLVVRVLRLGACDYIPKHGDYVARLPAILKHAIEEHRSRAKSDGGERTERRVLYVEHHPADVEFTVRQLAELAPHLQVEVVSSASAALARLSDESFDLVLADLRLPEMSAVELLVEAKHRGLAVPFIVVTGGGDETTAVAALKLGAYDYIVKRDDYVTRLPYAIDHVISRHHLARMNQELQDVARQKDEFLAMLGHELRNPLAPIRTALDLLRRSAAPLDISANAHDVIDRQITHMARLIDDLLDVARITTGQIDLKMEVVNVQRVVTDAIDGAAHLIAARRHRLETSLPNEPLTIRGDVTRLVQVLVNLLNNAAKYTNEGGTIRLDVTSENDHVVLRVTDTGVGISPRLLPKIFDLFTQDDRTLDRAQGGLGLGLTLVRRITDLHGGVAEAQSEGRDRGSVFTIRLPIVADGAVTPTEAAAIESRPARALRCLVVEDNVDAARMLELALTLEGHQVAVAFDGHAALQVVGAFQPDVVILDIGLPRVNGYEVARAIRQLPGLANVHIIAVTGYGQLVDQDRSREAGFDTHLVKPVQLDELLRIVEAGRGGSD